jgi:hypothetical protein
MDHCCEISIPTFHDPRGTLTVVESGQDIPFDIKRVFTLTNCHGLRGGHVNPGAYVLSPVGGAFYVEVEDPFGARLWHGTLVSAGKALYTPAYTAVHLSRWTEHAVCLVLSDWHYPHPETK